MSILRLYTQVIFIAALLALQFAWWSPGHASQEQVVSSFHVVGVFQAEQINLVGPDKTLSDAGEAAVHSISLVIAFGYDCPSSDPEKHGVACASGCAGGHCQPFVMDHGLQATTLSPGESFPFKGDRFSKLFEDPEDAPPRV